MVLSKIYLLKPVMLIIEEIMNSIIYLKFLIGVYNQTLSIHACCIKKLNKAVIPAGFKKKHLLFTHFPKRVLSYDTCILDFFNFFKVTQRPLSHYLLPIS